MDQSVGQVDSMVRLRFGETAKACAAIGFLVGFPTFRNSILAVYMCVVRDSSVCQKGISLLRADPGKWI